MHVQLQQFWWAVTLLFSAVFVEADISQIEVFSKNYQRQESDSEKLWESTEKETKKQVNESTRSGDTFSEFWTGRYLNNVQSESQVIEFLSLKTKEKRQKFC